MDAEPRRGAQAAPLGRSVHNGIDVLVYDAEAWPASERAWVLSPTVVAEVFLGTPVTFFTRADGRIAVATNVTHSVRRNDVGELLTLDLIGTPMEVDDAAQAAGFVQHFH